MRVKNLLVSTLKKPLNKVRGIVVSYSPYMISSVIAPPRNFPYMLVTSANAIKKRVPIKKRKDVPNRYIMKGIDWDELTIDVCDSTMHPTICDIFVEGKHFTETKQYHTMIAAVDSFADGNIEDPGRHGGYWCKSREDVEKYFEILLDCYNSIKHDGYKTQEQIYRETGAVGSGYLVRSLKDEITVFIDNNGDLVFTGKGANHRFSIVQLLDIKHLPVRLIGIDERYVKKMFNNYFFMDLEEISRNIILSHNGLEFMVSE